MPEMRVGLLILGPLFAVIGGWLLFTPSATLRERFRPGPPEFYKAFGGFVFCFGIFFFLVSFLVPTSAEMDEAVDQFFARDAEQIVAFRFLQIIEDKCPSPFPQHFTPESPAIVKDRKSTHLIWEAIKKLQEKRHPEAVARSVRWHCRFEIVFTDGSRTKVSLFDTEKFGTFITIPILCTYVSLDATGFPEKIAKAIAERENGD